MSTPYVCLTVLGKRGVNWVRGAGWKPAAGWQPASCAGKALAPNYGGVLSTSGGVLFYSESTGAFAAVDAQTGSML
jgi:hypothetical protein